MSSLFHLSDLRSYHLYRKETDMRKGFNLLCGIVINELGREVISGDAFIFLPARVSPYEPFPDDVSPTIVTGG